MGKKLVTASEFFDAFKECWKEEAVDSKTGVMRPSVFDAYNNSDQTWTDFMLGEKEGIEDSFLYKVKDKLTGLSKVKEKLSDRSKEPFKMGREWHKMIDAHFYSGKNLFGPEGSEYPPIVDVFIEHENIEGVETEMWRLLLLRSPLKVIIFYDNYEENKEKDSTKAKWLTEELCKLAKMATREKNLWPENKDTEYLFIVGSRKNKNDTQVCWRGFDLEKNEESSQQFKYREFEL